jgi:hypothetical protein
MTTTRPGRDALRSAGFLTRRTDTSDDRGRGNMIASFIPLMSLTAMATLTLLRMTVLQPGSFRDRMPAVQYA